MKKIILFFTCACLLSLSQADNNVSLDYCNNNKSEAIASAKKASEERELTKRNITSGAIAGGGCGILLVAAFFDYGVSSIVCGLVAAGAVAVSLSTEKNGIYTETYEKSLDTRCSKYYK